MPSNKKTISELAKEIVVKDKAMFDTLLEFEQTKQIRTKERLNFTIDKSLAAQFKKFCRAHSYNMSAKIEKAMEEMLKEENVSRS